MLTILSTLISFLMGGLPKLLDFFQDRNDKKHELALAQMQIERELELRKAGFEAQEILDEKNAAIKKKEMDELINWLLGGAIVILVLGLVFWWLTLLMGK